MARSLSSLATSMRARADRLPTLASDIAREGAEAVLTEWLEVMPVDTSEAISNTQIGIDSLPSGPVPPHFLGRKGSTRSASSDKARTEGMAKLASKKPGQVIYISNTAKHIGDLDRGGSTQFAGGFVPRALIAFRVAAQAAVKRLLK